MQEHRALILRSNRFLGSSLVDKGIVAVGDLEAANEKFMEAIQSSELKHASILTTLIYDLKVLDERKVIEYQVEEHSLGLVDLDAVELGSLRQWNLEETICFATSTLPFDKVENTYMVATCYYLSAPVVKHWESMLDGDIIWYVTSTQSMNRALERIEEIHKDEDEAAAEAE
ncbi:hypothetical protein [Coraliomargarita parva]|uniref:hypothetical protein n=1 Tax=Coraliomargarita parva TaxID=3014050 RepID=UPI0022B55C78|nr:hypothetical protein [Coraliomargarita parva]